MLVLAIMVCFKLVNFANHHYKIFLLAVIFSGFFLVLTGRAIKKREGAKEIAGDNEGEA